MPPSAEASHHTKGLVRLTMACNERCPFCNVPAEDYPTRPTPASELSAALADFVAAGEQTLTISGGEPTLLRKRLVALVREARGLGLPFVELQTNAVLIDEAYARELAEAGLTSAFVSLLSQVPALHDHLAGLDGAFPRCLAGIDALIRAGVRVTLNPVLALPSQSLLPGYVDFVGERLPGVRSISLSAVQPHGRARANAELLPDYAVLGPAVREARARAQRWGISLLNPYCGLPLCVGWAEDAAHSVEAQGTPLSAPGVENTGDKSYGPPCRRCAYQSRCGGAWHAYWTLRQGSGLRAPAERGEPWSGARVSEHERVIDARLGAPALASPEPDTPTVWLLTDRPSDLQPEVARRCTDLGWTGGLRERAALAGLRGLARQGSPRLRVALPFVSEAAQWEEIRLAAALGVSSIRLLGGGESLAQMARRRLPELDLEALP